jgi:hypothetical protein
MINSAHDQVRRYNDRRAIKHQEYGSTQYLLARKFAGSENSLSVAYQREGRDQARFARELLGIETTGPNGSIRSECD